MILLCTPSNCMHINCAIMMFNACTLHSQQYRHRLLRHMHHSPLHFIFIIMLFQRHAGIVELVDIVPLTESVVRVGKKESISCQEEEVDQVRDQIDKEDTSPVLAPLVVQQT